MTSSREEWPTWPGSRGGGGAEPQRLKAQGFLASPLRTTASSQGGKPGSLGVGEKGKKGLWERTPCSLPSCSCPYK